MPFDRLLRRVDELCGAGVIGEPVVAQIGHSSYLPKNFLFRRFFEPHTEANLIKESRLVIAHGGSGTIVQCLRANKVVIAVPRLSKFLEHVDDHQIEIVEELSARGYLLASNVNDLDGVLMEALNFRPQPFATAPQSAHALICRFLEQMRNTLMRE